jgi:DNA-binding GntR family transcriptional regulator
MERPQLSPLETTTLATQVQRSLEHAIFTGELKPGERLIEVDLAEALQVSRASLREALRLLENRGLVVITHRRGAYVIDLSDDDIRDIYGVRLLLENHAIRCATERPDSALIARLEQLIETMRTAADERDYFAIVDLDLEFHREICTATGNRRLLTMWGDLVAPTRALLLTKYRLFDDSAEITHGHEILRDAILQGDADHAAKLLERHVIDTHEAIVQSLAHERVKPAGISAAGA